MLQSTEIKIDNLTFDCRVAGKPENEMIILLHGFPETNFMWRNLMTDLSNKGYFCVAPNQRGFSKNACPKGKRNYAIEALVGDVMGLARHFKKGKFHLVGHDWGAAVGWGLVHDHPEVILSWTGISVPHLQSFGYAIAHDAEQRKMSQYIKLFQWPFVPEFLIRRNDFKIFRKTWRHSKDEEVEDYLSIFRNRKQLTAALNFYRGNFQLLKRAAKEEILGDIHVPTLFIWGKKDMAIGAASVEGGHQYMKGYYKYVELDSGHWLIQTQYEELKVAISEHVLMHSEMKT